MEESSTYQAGRGGQDYGGAGRFIKREVTGHACFLKATFVSNGVILFLVPIFQYNNQWCYIYFINSQVNI